LPPPDADAFPSTRHLRDDLRGRSVKGGAVMIVVQGCRFFLNVGSTAVLARLLTPGDFGLIAMVVTVTGFVAMFKDLGLSAAVVQRAEITRAQLSTLFWIVLGFSAVIALATVAAAPAVAWFYDDARLQRLVPVIAAGFVCSGLTALHQALLRRQMRFAALALVELVGMVSGIGVAIYLAFAQFGYWALAGRQLAELGAVMAGVWLVCGWRPGRPGRGSGIRSMLGFGGNLAGFNILSYLARNLDNALLGWRWGVGVLGLYDKAYQLLYLPIQQINTPVSSVAVPALSRLQHDPVRFREYYRKGLTLVAALGMPVVGFMLAAADELVLAVLGDQWLGVVPIFRLLGPAVFLGTFSMATGWVYVSLGRTDRQLRWQIFGSTVVCLAFVLGLRWGAIGVAAGYSAASLLLRYPALAYCFRGTPIRVRDLAHSLWRPAAASLGAAAVTYAVIRTFFPAGNLGLALPAGLVLYVFCYLLTWLALPGGRRWLGETIRLAKEVKPG